MSERSLTTSAGNDHEYEQGRDIGRGMVVQRVNLQTINQAPHITTLSGLEVGESVYCTDLKQAQSLRALSYYMVRSRQLARKFTFRKMDRGWRIIRTE